MSHGFQSAAEGFGHGQVKDKKERTAGEKVTFPGCTLFPVGMFLSKPSGYPRKGKDQKYQILNSLLSKTDEFTMTWASH